MSKDRERGSQSEKPLLGEWLWVYYLVSTPEFLGLMSSTGRTHMIPRKSLDFTLWKGKQGLHFCTPVWLGRSVSALEKHLQFPRRQAQYQRQVLLLVTACYWAPSQSIKASFGWAPTISCPLGTQMSTWPHCAVLCCGREEGQNQRLLESPRRNFHEEKKVRGRKGKLEGVQGRLQSQAGCGCLSHSKGSPSIPGLCSFLCPMSAGLWNFPLASLSLLPSNCNTYI